MQKKKKPGYGSYGIWPLLPLHFPFLPSPLQTGLAEQLAWADGGSWPFLSLFSGSLGAESSLLLSDLS